MCGHQGRNQPSAALVVGIELVIVDQALDVIERLSCILEDTALPLRRVRGERARDDKLLSAGNHAAATGAGADAERAGLNHRDMQANGGQFRGGREAAVAAAHHDYVSGFRQCGRRRRLGRRSLPPIGSVLEVRSEALSGGHRRLHQGRRATLLGFCSGSRFPAALLKPHIYGYRYRIQSPFPECARHSRGSCGVGEYDKTCDQLLKLALGYKRRVLRMASSRK